MSTDTANYGFKKDNEDEFYNVNVVNANLDKIDTELKRIEDTIPPISPTDSVKWLGTVGGTANALTANDPDIESYKNGLAVSFPVNANSTAAMTLNINGLGAIPIKKANGTAFSNAKVNGVYTVRYRAGSFILQGEGGEYGNATENEVAKGKTFGTDEGLKTGTATISKLAPFIPNAQAVYTNGPLYSWNWLERPCFSRNGYFGIASQNGPANINAGYIYQLNASATSYYVIIGSHMDSNLLGTFLMEAFDLRPSGISGEYYLWGSSTGMAAYIRQRTITLTSNVLSGEWQPAKPVGPMYSGTQEDGYLYTLERAAGTTYLHKMYAHGTIIQTFSVPLDSLNYTEDSSTLWRSQMLDGFIVFTRLDMAEVKIYDLTLTLVKTIVQVVGNGQDAFLLEPMRRNMVDRYGGSYYIHDRKNKTISFKSSQQLLNANQPFMVKVFTFPEYWLPN
ncbi:hypothetical protein [Lysinibacillus fusiformis]|uniref:hypothetical protein n=1 Tax=Lysinibacillus fusiformis TaxID=28031 RepID=UPI0034E2AFB3